MTFKLIKINSFQCVSQVYFENKNIITTITHFEKKLELLDTGSLVR